jgi:pyruvate/2-oxoglutarate/acetoin dehydrogenase E1 component
VEEGSGPLGWGAELAARAAEALGPTLKTVARLTARPTPVPASLALERFTLPQLDDILLTIKNLFGQPHKKIFEEKDGPTSLHTFAESE